MIPPDDEARPAPLPERAHSGVDRALGFLAGRQLPDGEFPTLVFPTGKLDGPSEPDSTNFPTCLIAYSLGFTPDPRAARMVRAALGFLKGNLEPPGVLRYWTPKSPLHRYMPPDVDDTCCAADALRRGGLDAGVDRDVLLANRTSSGLFYTWMLPPLLARIRSGAVVRLLRRLVFPAAHFIFWWRTPAAPDDVDAAVNANVLVWLGEGDHARPVIDHLVRVLEEGREGSSDKWYQDPYSVYYLVSRAYREGIGGLGRAGPVIVSRIASALSTHAEALTELQLAQAACALMSFDHGEAELEAALELLLARQRPDGSWPVFPAYFGKHDYFWGSSELTTAFAAEALSRFVSGRRGGQPVGPRLETRG